MTGPIGSQTYSDDDHVRLKPGTRRVRRSGALLLVAPETNLIMVSPIVDQIWQSLVGGTTFAALQTELQQHRPRAKDVRSKLSAFLNRLSEAGLLEGSSPGQPDKTMRLEFPIAPLATRLASVVHRLPSGAASGVCGALALGAAGSLIALLASPSRPRLTSTGHYRSVPGAIAILAQMCLHELGHATACQLAGEPTGPAGIRFNRLGMPRPYVATPRACGIERPLHRALVAAGGPLVDLLVGGASAIVVLALKPAGLLGEVANIVALYSLVAVNVGTSPLPQGDGSRVLEALLDDDFARAAALGRPSRFTRPTSTRWYRAICAVHVGCSIALVGRLR
jgi:hypothetical protein